MKLWSDFFDYILPDVPSCPQDVAALHVRSVVMDFFDSTGVYVVTHDPVDVVENTHTYNFAPPTGYDVARIHTAWFDGTELTSSGEDNIRRAILNWTTKTGEPTHTLCENQSSVRLVPIPNRSLTAGLEMRVVLKPTRTSTGISTDWVFDRWVEIMAHGVKARLMEMPAKPWTNPALAVYHSGKYHMGVGDALRDANRALGRSTLAVQMRPSA